MINGAQLLLWMVLFLIPSMTVAATPLLNPSQIRVLNEAMQIGAEYGVGNTLAAVIWVESGLGKRDLGDHGKAFGPAQIHLPTARKTAEEPISVWFLRYDWQTNMVIAAWFLRTCQKKFGYTGGIACFNRGLYMKHPRHPETIGYVRAVLAKLYLINHLPISGD